MLLLLLIYFQPMAWSQPGADQGVLYPTHPVHVGVTQYKVYVFLSDGCPMCQGYAGTLIRLHEQYTLKGVEFVGVFPNYYVTDSAIGAFQTQFRLPFEVLKDENFALTDQFGADTTPQVFVTQADGKTVVYKGLIDNAYFRRGKRRGTTSAFYLQDALDALLKQQKITTTETQAIGCVIVRN